MGFKFFLKGLIYFIRIYFEKESIIKYSQQKIYFDK